MEAVRLFLLVLALILLVFGLVVWVVVRPSMRVIPALRFSPIWKQRPMFASFRKYQWYVVGVNSVAVGSLLMAIAILLG